MISFHIHEGPRAVILTKDELNRLRNGSFGLVTLDGSILVVMAQDASFIENRLQSAVSDGVKVNRDIFKKIQDDDFARARQKHDARVKAESDQAAARFMDDQII